MREARRRARGAKRIAIVELSSTKAIDGSVRGGPFQFVNHSCDPNCEVDEIKDRVWIKSIRDIEPGEELLWDYNLYDDDDPAPCYCGSPKCRGTMYSEEWMAKLRRNARRKPERSL